MDRTNSVKKDIFIFFNLSHEVGYFLQMMKVSGILQVFNFCFHSFNMERYIKLTNGKLLAGWHHSLLHGWWVHS